MKRFFRAGLPLIAVAVLAMAFLASCSQHVKGKMYVNDTDTKQIMEFHGKNIVVLRSSSSYTSGLYTVTGDIILVKIGSDERIYRILSTKHLLCEADSATPSVKGSRWTKQ